MTDATVKSLRESHVRLGTQEHGVWLPREWEHEALALLYAMRKEHAPFAKMPSFDTSELNPLHGVEASALRRLSKLVAPKAPWDLRDADVTVTLGGAQMGSEVLPVVFLKMNEPMVHVAVAAFLATLSKWTFALALEEGEFVAEFRSSKGELLWGFSTPALRDDDSLLLRRYMAVKQHGVLSVPLTTRFYHGIRPSHSPANATLAECQNFYFFSQRKVQPVAKADGAKTRLARTHELYALAA